MTFSGRGFLNPLITYTSTAEAIGVRVDCDDNAEAWCELWVTREELVRMVEMIDALCAAEPGETTA